MPESGVMLPSFCSLRVTVPSVVGFQVSWVDSPAVKSKPPLGTLKELSLPCAAARAARALRAR